MPTISAVRSVDIAEGGVDRRGSAALTTRRSATRSTSATFRAIANRAAPQVAIHVGVSGLALVGPGGLARQVFHRPEGARCNYGATRRPVYQKSYKVEVDTAGALHGTFEMVLDPIVLPLTRTDLDAQYELTIGLGNSVSAKPVKVAEVAEEHALTKRGLCGLLRRVSQRHPAEESGPARKASEPAPKAQPPRKRSGLKDRWVMTLWKAATASRPGAHRRR